MKKILIITVLAGFCSMTQAQQLQTSSFYDMQGVLHNPSTAGVYKNNFVGLTYRNQWSGISGTPKTMTVFGSFDLPKQRIGVGGFVYNDQTGPTSRAGAIISLAKHIVMKDNDILSFGIETEFQQYSIDKTKLSASLGNDPVLGGNTNHLNFDAGFGISYTGSKLQLGASVMQLVQSQLNFYSGNLTRTDQARLYRHFYIHGAYKWDVDGHTTITPNMMWIMLPNAPSTFQATVRVEHNEMIWWGLGIRANQNYMASVGVNIMKKLSLGYCYDTYQTPLSLFDGGSSASEFLLRYNFVK